MNQDLSMYRPAVFSIIYGLENTAVLMEAGKERIKMPISIE
jgi:hypothetical protein